MKTRGATILHFRARWNWVVSLTSRSLYLRGNLPHYLFDRLLCRPQMYSGSCGEEKNLVLTGNRNQGVQPVAIPTALSRRLFKENVWWKLISELF
jgi:hypothetical protein